MPAVTGRTTEPRAVTVTTTLSSTAITAPAGTFSEEDVNRPIAGPGIPAGATLVTITSPTAATMSAAASAIGTVTATIGAATPAATLAAAQAHGFIGWSPETDTESETYSVAAAGAGTVTPDRITNTTTDRTAQQRNRA